MKYIIQVNQDADQTSKFYLNNYIREDGFYQIVNSKEHALIFSYKKAVEICFWLNNCKNAIDFAVMVEVA